MSELKSHLSQGRKLKDCAEDHCKDHRTRSKPGSMENVPFDACSDEQPCPGDTGPVRCKGSGWDGRDLRWDMKLQEDPFYT